MSEPRPEHAASVSDNPSRGTAPTGTASAGTASSRRLRGWRRVVFPLMALLLVPFLMVGIELLLYMIDVGRPSDLNDPLSGFSEVHDLFELDESGSVYRTAVSRQIFFGTQEFPAEKADGTFRAFCLGGSTVRGRPYQTQTAFASWLDVELTARAPDRNFEIINCGGLSYASYRLVPLLTEVLEHRPDVIIVATGHNEFLEDRTYRDVKSRSAPRAWLEDRLYQSRLLTVVREWMGAGSASSEPGANQSEPLDGEVQARLDESTGYATYHRDDQWRRQVAAQFEDSLQQLIGLCREANVPIVFVRLGSNLRDCPPFKSEHSDDISAEALREFQRLFDAGGAVDRDDPVQALEFYYEAEQIDPRYPLLLFRIARALDRLGQTKVAEAYYIRARDEDICPLRMVSDLAQVLTDVAASEDVTVVNADSLLVPSGRQLIPGFDVYMDHVHPTIGGHQQIAQALAGVLADLGLVTRAPLDASRRRAAYRAHFAELDVAYFANGGRRVGWLENWARRYRLLGEIPPVDVNGYLRFAQREFDFARDDKAWMFYEKALMADSTAAHRILRHAVGLFRQGRPRDSRRLLDYLAEHSGPVGDSATASRELAEAITIGKAVIAVETEDEAALRQLGPELLPILERDGDRFAGPHRQEAAERERGPEREGRPEGEDEAHPGRLWERVMPDIRSRAQNLLSPASAQ